MTGRESLFRLVRRWRQSLIPNRLWRVFKTPQDRDTVIYQPPFWRLDNHVHGCEVTRTALAAGAVKFPVSRGLTGTYNDPRAE